MTQPGNAPPRSRLRWPVMCWVAVLVLTGTVQVMRQQWFDTAFFFAAAALTVAGPWLPGREARKTPPGGALSGIVVAAGAGLSILPRHSGWMAGGLALVGLAAVWFAWSWAPGSPQSRRRWTPGLRKLGFAWAGLIVAGCIWELAQFIVGYLKPNQPSYALSNLIDPLLDDWLGKTVFAVAWLAVGAFLLRRGLGRGDRR